jgi:hypothetical protein
VFDGLKIEKDQNAKYEKLLSTNLDDKVDYQK